MQILQDVQLIQQLQTQTQALVNVADYYNARILWGYCVSFPGWMQYYACQVQSSARSRLQQLSSYTTLVKLQLDSLFYLNAMCAHQAALAARPTASCARGRRCAASLARYVCVSSRQEENARRRWPLDRHRGRHQASRAEPAQVVANEPSGADSGRPVHEDAIIC